MKRTCSHWTCSKQVPAKYRYCYEHRPDQDIGIIPAIAFLVVVLIIFL